MDTSTLAKVIQDAKQEEMFNKMWLDLNSTMNKVLKAKIGPYERQEFLEHLPFVIKGLYIDGHADKAQILEKKLAKYARNLRLPLEPLLGPLNPAETQEKAKEEIPSDTPVSLETAAEDLKEVLNIDVTDLTDLTKKDV